MKTKILIVDDHLIVIEGLKSLLAGNESIDCVGAVTNAFDAILFLRNHEVDIAFLDINLPEISGIELCKKITDEFTNVKCIALTTFAERSYISRMIQSGAMGYLLKSSSKEELFEAVEQVSKGGYFMNVNLTETTKTESEKKAPYLTLREKEVLKHIAEGLTNPQIAEKLFVSTLTVNSHRKSLLLKFDVQNTAHLIKLASQWDLI
ncbi:MAG: response regulator transcription factor [Bacteroidota bacterium]